MKKSGIKIEVHQINSKDNNVHIAVGFKGGYATRNYLVNESERFSGNYAFSFVLFDYLKYKIADSNYKFNVTKSSSIISFKNDTDDWGRMLKRILSELVALDFQEELFEQAKKLTMQNFRHNYKRESFRAKYRGYEFADSNKDFSLRALIEDINRIEFDEFKKCAEKILIPGNLYILIKGTNIDADLLNRSIKELILKNITFLEFDFNKHDPYFKRDFHIMNIARNDYYYNIISFDFLDEYVNIYLKKMIVDFYARRLHDKEVLISIDEADSSICFESKEIRDYKGLFRTPITKNEFDVIKRTLVNEWHLLMTKYSGNYVLEAMHSLINGINVLQYYDYIVECDYETFLRLSNYVDYKVSQAQIIFKKAE